MGSLCMKEIAKKYNATTWVINQIVKREEREWERKNMMTEVRDQLPNKSETDVSPSQPGPSSNLRKGSLEEFSQEELDMIYEDWEYHLSSIGKRSRSIVIAKKYNASIRIIQLLGKKWEREKLTTQVKDQLPNQSEMNASTIQTDPNLNVKKGTIGEFSQKEQEIIFEEWKNLKSVSVQKRKYEIGRKYNATAAIIQHIVKKGKEEWERKRMIVRDQLLNQFETDVSTSQPGPSSDERKSTLEEFSEKEQDIIYEDWKNLISSVNKKTRNFVIAKKYNANLWAITQIVKRGKEKSQPGPRRMEKDVRNTLEEFCEREQEIIFEDWKLSLVVKQARNNVIAKKYNASIWVIAQ